MSGDYPSSDVISGIYNGTDNDPPEEAAGTHIDDPNGSLYMLCGVLIAMLLVGVIIVLLAVTIRFVISHNVFSVLTCISYNWCS